MGIRKRARQTPKLKPKEMEKAKTNCLLEYRTGAYTQRELSERHRISLALVAKITKPIDKDLVKSVNAQVNSAIELSELSVQDSKVVHEASKKQIDALKLDNFLDGVLAIAAKRSKAILEDSTSTMADVERFGNFQNAARVGLKTQAKHANTNINIEQSNQTAIVPKNFSDFYND